MFPSKTAALHNDVFLWTVQRALGLLPVVLSSIGKKHIFSTNGKLVIWGPVV